jgi:hypothetical protein
LPKRLLFTMLRNTDFTRMSDTKPYLFKHFKFNHFLMYVNGWQVPSGGLTLNRPMQRLARWPIRRSSATLVCTTGTRASEHAHSVHEMILHARLRPHALRLRLGMLHQSPRKRQHTNRIQIRRGSHRGSDHPAVPGIRRQPIDR